MMWNRLKAIIIRDIQHELSYKTSFLMEFLGIIFTVLLWFFMAKFIGDSVDIEIAGQEVGYFSFVLVGIAGMRFLNVAMTSFSTKLREEQLSGTLEALLVTSASLPAIVISWACWDFLLAGFNILLTIVLGAAFFGFQINFAGVFTFMVVLVLTIFPLSAMGIISASIIMVLKKGNPLNYLFSNISALLGGVFFPVSVLPDWLQSVARLIPLPWALDALRKSLIQGGGFGDVYLEINVLILFTVVLVPLSFFVFRIALNRVRVDGSLCQY